MSRVARRWFKRCGAGRSMALSRMIPLPESRPVLSAPPARFKSGRRAPGGVGRSPNRPFSLRSRGLRGRSKVCNFRLPEVRNFRLPLTVPPSMSQPAPSSASHIVTAIQRRSARNLCHWRASESVIRRLPLVFVFWCNVAGAATGSRGATRTLLGVGGGVQRALGRGVEESWRMRSGKARRILSGHRAKASFTS